MKSFKKLLFGWLLTLFWLCMFSNNNVVLADGENTQPANNSSITAYDEILGFTISNSNSSLKSALKREITWKWWEAVNNVVYSLIWYMINVFIVIWILLAFFGWYKIMVSNSQDNLKEWIRLVAFGVVWVIVMVSAKFLAYNIIENLENNMVVSSSGDPNWIRIVSNLYDRVLYPFIKIALYLVIWVLFVMMAIKVFTFVVSTEEKAKKQAWWIILWTVIGILVIMWAKQLVEAVMWKQELVMNPNAYKVGWWGDNWMWSQILQFGSVPIISQVINWVMWLTMLIVLVLVIVQAYKMFAKPDDPKNRESLKKTLLYIIIWVLVIWASYIISNVLVVNNINN